MDHYVNAFKKYLEFSGRARRAEYWSFFIVNMVATFALTLMDVIGGTFSKTLGIGLFAGVFSLFILLPSIAVGVRRLHDTNRSAWWLLLALVPLVGPLALIVIYCLDGTPGENEYGADPKATAPEAPAYPVPPPPPAA